MSDEQIYVPQLTQYGINLIEEHSLAGNTPFITDGWYIALGTGELVPDLNTAALVNQVFDKNSPGYMAITFGHEEGRGRFAQLEIPTSLTGMVISELGLFDENDKLVICQKTHIDLLLTQSTGIINKIKVKLYLHAIPAQIGFVSVNTSFSYPTKEEVQEIMSTGISAHNLDTDAHTYLARLNGNEGQNFKVAQAQNNNEAVNLGQLNGILTDKKTVTNLGNVSGSVTLQYDKLYKAQLAGDTTIVLAEPENNNELYNTFFSFTNPNAQYTLTLPQNVQYNNAISPNYKVTNQQRIIFETIDRGETVTAYYGKRG